jgi:glycosyltransferase involved in cell wall biosynthesis
MVMYDPQAFGGLEEYATNLAVALQARGHPVSVVSGTWVPPENQYRRRLSTAGIPFVQLPSWIFRPAYEGAAKSALATRLLLWLSPMVWLLTLGLWGLRRRPWRSAIASARGWLHAFLVMRVFHADWRPVCAQLVLAWWRIWWRPDILHIHGFFVPTSDCLFIIDWARARRLAVVYQEHQTPDASYGPASGFCQAVNQAQAVVAVSHESAEALRSVAGIHRPIFVSGPIVPDPRLAGWSAEAKRQASGVSTFVSTLARLASQKGLTYLLETIDQVGLTHPNAQFRVYGDGPLRQELLAHASQLGLDGGQIFVGAFDHSDVSGILAATDIFVLSSLLEGQPVSVIEAMAHGCPIVATRVGGIPELIRHGVNGLLCPPGDAAALAHNIRQLLDDPGLRLRLGQAARQAYDLGPFQPAAVCDYFLSIYIHVLQAQHRELLDEPIAS